LSFKLFNSDFVDSFEFNTDQRTISEALSEGNKPEASQRYMNPETIEKYIKTIDKYNSIK